MTRAARQVRFPAQEWSARQPVVEQLPLAARFRLLVAFPPVQRLVVPLAKALLGWPVARTIPQPVAWLVESPGPTIPLAQRAIRR